MQSISKPVAESPFRNHRVIQAFLNKIQTYFSNLTYQASLPQLSRDPHVRALLENILSRTDRPDATRNAREFLITRPSLILSSQKEEIECIKDPGSSETIL